MKSRNVIIGAVDYEEWDGNLQDVSYISKLRYFRDRSWLNNVYIILKSLFTEGLRISCSLFLLFNYLDEVDKLDDVDTDDDVDTELEVDTLKLRKIIGFH